MTPVIAVGLGSPGRAPTGRRILEEKLASRRHVRLIIAAAVRVRDALRSLLREGARDVPLCAPRHRHG